MLRERFSMPRKGFKRFLLRSDVKGPSPKLQSEGFEFHAKIFQRRVKVDFARPKLAEGPDRSVHDIQRSHCFKFFQTHRQSRSYPHQNSEKRVREPITGRL